MLQKLAFSASVILMSALPAFASVEGIYQIQSLACRYNQEVIPNCEVGETLNVVKEANGDYRVQEVRGGKVTRSWFVSERSVSTPDFVLTALLKVTDTSLEYSEDRVTYFPGDSRRQFYQTWLVLRESAPGRYILNVRQSQVRESVAELTGGGVSELSYGLIK